MKNSRRAVSAALMALAAFALEAKTVRFDFPQWETNTWVFLPACAYNGNSDFAGVKAEAYPPGPSAAVWAVSPRTRTRPRPSAVSVSFLNSRRLR